MQIIDLLRFLTHINMVICKCFYKLDILHGAFFINDSNNKNDMTLLRESG